MNHTLLATLALALAGCAANDPQRITDAATAPLNDLNLVNAAIPSVLADAQRQPYALTASSTCDTLAGEVRALEEVLGADLDAPPTQANPGLLPRATAALTDATVGAIRGASEGLVPYRSWVRKLSGAERYSKDVAAAIAAGTVRRSFLKGVRSGRACTAVVAAAAGAASAPK